MHGGGDVISTSTRDIDPATVSDGNVGAVAAVAGVGAWRDVDGLAALDEWWHSMSWKRILSTKSACPALEPMEPIHVQPDS